MTDKEKMLQDMKGVGIDVEALAEISGCPWDDVHYKVFMADGRCKICSAKDMERAIRVKKGEEKFDEHSEEDNG